jgi:hypothetical protein
MLPFDVTIPATVTQRWEILEGFTNYPVFLQQETLHRNIMNQASSLKRPQFHFNLKKQTKLFPLKFRLTSHAFVALQLANLNDHCTGVY